MKFSKEDNRQFWERQALAWAEPAHHPLVGVLSRKYDPEQIRAIRDFLLPYKELFSNPTVKKLDLGSSGCGLPGYLGGDPDVKIPDEHVGSFLESNLAQFPNLVAADISRLALTSYPSAYRVQLDAEKTLPFADGCFDVIDLMFLTRYVPQLPLIGELNRLLSQNGKLIIIDFLTLNHIKETEQFDPWLWQKELAALGYNVTITHLLPQVNPPNFDPKFHQLYAVVAERKVT